MEFFGIDILENCTFNIVSNWKDVLLIIGSIISIFSLWKGIKEYSRQGTQKRADYFFELRSRFLKDPTILNICLLCETNDSKLREIPLNDKYNFLGIFEEVALSMNSKLINKDVVHYMFGYYAIMCWESSNFWYGINKEDRFWATFHLLVNRVYKIDTNIKIRQQLYNLNIKQLTEIKELRENNKIPREKLPYILKLFKLNFFLCLNIFKNYFIHKKLKL